MTSDQPKFEQEVVHLGKQPLEEIVRQRAMVELRERLSLSQVISTLTPMPEPREAPSERKRAPKGKKNRRKLTQASKRKNRG